MVASDDPWLYLRRPRIVRNLYPWANKKNYIENDTLFFVSSEKTGKTEGECDDKHLYQIYFP